MELKKSQLHPGARWYFRLRGYGSVFFFGVFIAIFLGSILSPLLMANRGAAAPFNFILLIIEIFAVYAVIAIILVEIYARMSYNRWFFEFTPTNLKIERGIIWKRYSNVPYERIQNVDITRGIIARILGFSTLNLQTAGYSGYPARGYGAHSEGYIPAVSIESAEEIREFLMAKISKRNSKSGI